MSITHTHTHTHTEVTSCGLLPSSHSTTVLSLATAASSVLRAPIHTVSVGQVACRVGCPAFGRSVAIAPGGTVAQTRSCGERRKQVTRILMMMMMMMMVMMGMMMMMMFPHRPPLPGHLCAPPLLLNLPLVCYAPLGATRLGGQGKEWGATTLYRRQRVTDYELQSLLTSLPPSLSPGPLSLPPSLPPSLPLPPSVAIVF